MSRVIQDSDDEGDVAVDVVIAAAIVSPAKVDAPVAAVQLELSPPTNEQQAQQTPHARGTSSSGTSI